MTRGKQAVFEISIGISNIGSNISLGACISGMAASVGKVALCLLYKKQA